MLLSEFYLLFGITSTVRVLLLVSAIAAFEPRHGWIWYSLIQTGLSAFAFGLRRYAPSTVERLADVPVFRYTRAVVMVLELLSVWGLAALYTSLASDGADYSVLILMVGLLKFVEGGAFVVVDGKPLAAPHERTAVSTGIRLRGRF